MTKPKAELEQFIEEHGGIDICGDGPDGPSYILTDATTVAVPMDGDDFYFVLPERRTT